MRVDPKALVRRLDPACTQALEEAVASAASGRFYEIVVEHVLLALLEPADGEAAAVLTEVRRDRRRATTTLQNVLQRMRTGNAGRPVFSEGVFQLFEEAWLVASVEHGRQLLRPADVLLEFATRGNRYTAETIPELTGIPLDELRRIVASYSEQQPAAPTATQGAAPGAAGAPGAAPGAAAAGGGREMLARFTVSYTDRAKAGKIDPIFGRDAEIRQMIDILARRRKNNPILVGEPGVGKTALVEGLARAIVAGDVPSGLRDVELLGLDLGLLMAGAGVRGELENRLKKVIAEVKSSATPNILFIDEAHTIMGASGDSAELPNLLKPELARGELRTLAATTWSEYKKYFEKDAALARRFQLVKVGEPDQETAILMLRGLRDMYSKAHGVVIRDEAVVAAVELSERYISGRQLPDKAIDLIDTASARVKIEQDAPP
ncbi:MAG TPA: AAA family ATPase, partial [Nannocystis sp.]